MVAGDVRARVALREHLSKRSHQVLAQIEEGGACAFDEALQEAIARAVAEAAAHRRRSVVEKFEEERGQHNRAAVGLAVDWP